MKLIGLDLSLTATGVAVGESVVVIKTKTTGVERLNDIRSQLRKEIGRFNPKVAIIEGYAFGAHDRGARSIGELGGVVRLMLADYKIKFVEVPPASLKKFATGKGNADKDNVLAAAIKHNRRINNNNAADAWWLYQMGAAAYGQQVAPTLKIGKVRHTVLKAIEWPKVSG
jgi:crossover junction endodeoxyribonuclease RuvC